MNNYDVPTINNYNTLMKRTVGILSINTNTSKGYIETYINSKIIVQT